MLESLLTDRELIGLVVAAAAIWIVVAGSIKAAYKFRRKDRTAHYVARPQSNGDWKWERQ